MICFRALMWISLYFRGVCVRVMYILFYCFTLKKKEPWRHFIIDVLYRHNKWLVVIFIMLSQFYILPKEYRFLYSRTNFLRLGWISLYLFIFFCSCLIFILIIIWCCIFFLLASDDKNSSKKYKQNKLSHIYVLFKRY